MAASRTRRLCGAPAQLLRRHFLSVPRARFPTVQGHRGAPLLEPENTLAGFQRAAEVGADSVELDVFMTKDGIPVVFHGGMASAKVREKVKLLHPDSDPNDFLVGELSTLTKTEGNIQDLAMAEIGTLELNPAGYDCPMDRISQPSAYIPTLQEALLLCRTLGLHVTVELKGIDTPKPVVKMLQSLGMVEKVTVSSFTWSLVEEAKALEPDLHIALLFVEPPADTMEHALKYNASELHFRYDTVTKELVADAHRHGLTTMAWFRSPHSMKNEESYFFQLIEAGIDVICTNQPDALAELKQTLVLPKL